MNEKDILQLKHAIAMPAGLAQDLSNACCEDNRKKSRYSRRPGLVITTAILLCLCISSTSLAYNTYQEKQLAIFMNPELTQAQIESLGSELAKIADVSTCQYISGDEAWAEFKAAYFSDSPEAEALVSDFTENPLADSFNYKVSVRLGADTQTVREQIENLPGVRKITTVREAKQEREREN